MGFEAINLRRFILAKRAKKADTHSGICFLLFTGVILLFHHFVDPVGILLNDPINNSPDHEVAYHKNTGEN